MLLYQFTGMSRSIHTTRRTITELRKKGKTANAAERAELKKEIQTASAALMRKRLIKWKVEHERRASQPTGIKRLVSDLPVRIIETHPLLHYPVSEQDIRAVLSQLPEQATEGLAEIRLELGLDYMNAKSDPDDDRDPWFGRVGGVFFRGVYGGRALGTYCPVSAVISIYGNVYDPSDLPIPRPLVEMFLRIRGLMTLVHEVAHHHDEMCRVARGRWLADRHENLEHYAEHTEHRWTREVVLPYLEKAYPQDLRRLKAFVARKGGLKVGTDFFAGDDRTTLRNGLIRMKWCTRSAFTSWVDELHQHLSLIDSRLAFAWELHFCDLYAEFLHIVERCLKQKPEDAKLLTCRADTLIHLERQEESLDCVDQVLSQDPANPEVWQLKSWTWGDRQEWVKQLEVCDAWVKALPNCEETARNAALDRAIAFCGLRRDGDAREQLEIYLSHMRPVEGDALIRRRKTWWRNMHRRAGREVVGEF